MEDLISRQAAIDESFEIYVDGQNFEVVQVETLMGLPSAQPEITRCKDCKWCEDADGLMCKNTASWVVATDYDFGCVLAEPKTGKWIPCSERLPEPNRHDALNVDVYYLAQTEFGDMIVASYNESHDGTKWWAQMYSYRIFDDEIVAWMPLPEPWRPGND